MPEFEEFLHAALIFFPNLHESGIYALLYSGWCVPVATGKTCPSVHSEIVYIFLSSLPYKAL
jgi:hypothetical protein